MLATPEPSLPSVADRPTVTSLACQAPSTPVAELAGATVSTRIAALAWDGYGASPTAKIECGPSAGRGTASETLALPSPSASAGEPLNSAPEDASSSRKAIASFAAKPLSEPDRLARPEPPPNEPSPRVVGASVRLAAPTVTAPLLAL